MCWGQPCFKKKNKIRAPFQLGPSRMVPAKKDGEKGHSAVNEVVTREYIINIHKCTHGVGFKKHVPKALRGIQKFTMEETATPDLCIDTKLNKAIWVKGRRNVPFCIPVQLSENAMKMKSQQTSSIQWLPLCLSPLSKIYS